MEYIEFDGIKKEKEEELNKYLEDIKRNRLWGNLVSKKFEERSSEMINDTLFLMNEIKNVKGKKIIDIGSGGGIVGITLGIIDKELKITLVERSKKKCAFLAEEVSKMDLKNVGIKCMNAEDMIGEEEYEVSITRGVGTIERVVGVGLALLKKGGVYITIKGNNAEEEVEAAKETIRENGGRLIKVERQMEGGEEERERTAIVVIEKMM